MKYRTIGEHSAQNSNRIQTGLYPWEDHALFFVKRVAACLAWDGSSDCLRASECAQPDLFTSNLLPWHRCLDKGSHSAGK